MNRNKFVIEKLNNRGKCDEVTSLGYVCRK